MSSGGSDISSFAVWEAHIANPKISDREQSLLDMKDTLRVWPDRDSSNDARSSDGGSANEGGSSNGGVKQNNGGGAGMKPSMMRMEIPSSTQGRGRQSLGLSVVCASLPCLRMV